MLPRDYRVGRPKHTGALSYCIGNRSIQTQFRAINSGFSAALTRLLEAASRLGPKQIGRREYLRDDTPPKQLASGSSAAASLYGTPGHCLPNCGDAGIKPWETATRSAEGRAAFHCCFRGCTRRFKGFLAVRLGVSPDGNFGASRVASDPGKPVGEPHPHSNEG